MFACKLEQHLQELSISHERRSDVVQSGVESTHRNTVGRLYKAMLWSLTITLRFLNYSATE